MSLRAPQRMEIDESAASVRNRHSRASGNPALFPRQLDTRFRGYDGPHTVLDIMEPEYLSKESTKFAERSVPSRQIWKSGGATAVYTSKVFNEQASMA